MQFCTWLIGFWLVSAVLAFGEELPKPIQDGDYRTYTSAEIKLGQLLFSDRILSGTYRVSCATCHSFDRASSNGFRLDGMVPVEGDDLAINGLPLYDVFKPSAKHAPTLFNLGAKEFTVLFSDGRVARKKNGQFIAPAANELPDGLRDVLAVQALFPAVTGDELVGNVENEISAVAHLGNAAIWAALTKRVQDLPDYWPYFQAAYPRLKRRQEISIVEIANAISAFVGSEWRSDQSPFDAYLRGDDSALNAQEKRGLKLFYGAAQCSDCHSGSFQTDNQFYFAPNSFWRFDVEKNERTGDINLGRYKVSGKENEKFKIRTPSLRNVARTAPYGHAGGVESLRKMISLHLEPERALQEMQSDIVRLGLTEDVSNASQNLKYKGKVDLRSDIVINDLLAFLEALTDKKSLTGRLGKPKDVPSSLVLD